ncbi:replication initiator protein A [Paenisporosarcina quisquiliarum]|uniref:replication initiator protein A n=1 Tax=Paenisporosarcina quisquiliarum TaxID=365346 RepID=UPI0037356105
MSKKFRVQEEVGERFYRLPKIFFTSEQYKKMSNDAKIAFALLQDRLELSIRNQWFDEEGYIYFLFGNEQLSEILNCSKPTVIKIKKELQKADLLEEKRMGLSQSNRLYLLKPQVTIDDVMKLQEKKEYPLFLEPQQKLKNLTSRNQNSLLQEVKKFNTNDTDLSDTDFKETDYLINQGIDDIEMPVVIKEVLIKYKERLMDDGIKIRDIVNHYFGHASILTDYQYADALQYSLERTPGKIKSITARLTKAVEDKKEWLTIQGKKGNYQKKDETVPDWLLQQQHNRKTQAFDEQPDELTPEFLEKREELLAKLSK